MAVRKRPSSRCPYQRRKTTQLKKEKKTISMTIRGVRTLGILVRTVEGRNGSRERRSVFLC